MICSYGFDHRWKMYEALFPNGFRDHIRRSECVRKEYAIPTAFHKKVYSSKLKNHAPTTNTYYMGPIDGQYRRKLYLWRLASKNIHKNVLSPLIFQSKAQSSMRFNFIQNNCKIFRKPNGMNC